MMETTATIEKRIIVGLFILGVAFVAVSATADLGVQDQVGFGGRGRETATALESA
jgi:hypothetical protein